MKAAGSVFSALFAGKSQSAAVLFAAVRSLLSAAGAARHVGVVRRRILSRTFVTAETRMLAVMLLICDIAGLRALQIDERT